MESPFPFPKPVVLTIEGSRSLFPVRRIYCVGQNYADHVREMGGDPNRQLPVFFSKPADAAVPEGGDIPYPPLTSNLHYEVELVVALSRGGANLSVDGALDHVFGYGVGIDLTRRDLQALAKERGGPWDLAKGFDHSAPVSKIVPAASIGHPSAGAIWLQVNGTERQRGDLAQMIWRVPEVMAQLSAYVRLEPGDLIFTGTPAGVGAIVRGDRVKAGIEGIGELDIVLT